MIINKEIRDMAKEITDKLYRIYYSQLLNDEISKDEYYIQVLNDTIKYFSKIEEYEKCSDLENIKPIKIKASNLYGTFNKYSIK